MESDLPPGYRYGTLGPNQTRQIQEFLAAREWPFDRQKWLYLLRRGDLFGVYYQDALAATGGLHLWPHQAAVVVMIVVHPDHSGKGLGKAVTRRSVTEAGGAPCYLYSTEEGMPLYSRLGFVKQGESSVWMGGFEAPAPADLRVEDASLEQLAAFDRRVYGFDRSTFLASLLERALSAKVAFDGQKPLGYALCFQEETGLTLGPLVAEEFEVARVLAVAAAGDRKVTLYVPGKQIGFQTWLQDQSFKLSDRPPLMAPAGTELKTDWSRLFAIAGHAYG